MAGDPELWNSLGTYLAALGGGGGVVGLVARAVLSKATDDIRKELVEKIASSLDSLKKEITERFEKLDREMEKRDERLERQRDELVGRISKLESSYERLHARFDAYDGGRNRRKGGS